MHYAAGAGHVDAVKELVRLGAKLDARDDDGRTPLVHAVGLGCNPALVDLLLELGADIERADKLGMTALESAAMFGKIELVRHLLLRGAKPTGPTKATVFGPLCLAVGSGSIEIVQVLLNAGSPVDPEPGQVKDSALGAAGLAGRLDMVRLLLEAGANPNHRDANSYTPLMLAVRGKNPEIVRAIIRAGGDVNAESVDGMTALDRAIQQKSADLVAILHDAGATRANRFGPSPVPLKPPEEAKSEQFWQLQNDSVLTAIIEPWPPAPGPATLKAEVTPDDYGKEFADSLDYRITDLKNGNQAWFPMTKRGMAEDGSTCFADEIALSSGTCFVQFRIVAAAEKNMEELEGWRIKAG